MRPISPSCRWQGLMRQHGAPSTSDHALQSPPLMTSRITGGAVVLVPAKTGVLPVWACGLGRTLLAVEVRNAYWRQFHAMRVQAFIHATVFPRGSTAKPLRIRTAISSQGDLCLHIRRRWGPSGSRSPRYRGGSSNGWRRRRLWDPTENFLVGGL